MSLFGADPTLEALRSENAFLREQVQQLQNKLLALTDKAAYRLINPGPAAPHEGAPRLPAQLMFRRNVPFRPTRDAEDLKRDNRDNQAIHESFKRGEEKAG